MPSNTRKTRAKTGKTRAKTQSPIKTVKVQVKRNVRSASPIGKSTRKRLAQNRPKTPSPKTVSKAALGNPGKTPMVRRPYVPPHNTLQYKDRVADSIAIFFENSYLSTILDWKGYFYINRELQEMIKTDVMINDAQFREDFKETGMNHDTNKPTGELFKPSKRQLHTTGSKPKPSHIWKITGDRGTQKRGDTVKYGTYVEERFEELIYQLEDHAPLINRLVDEKSANPDHDSKLIPAALEEAEVAAALEEAEGGV